VAFVANLVDAYNIVSGEFAAGLGKYDVQRISPLELHVRRARGNEVIVPLFEDKPVNIPPGDLIYGAGDGSNRPFAALGRIDVDSDDYKVTASTAAILLVALGNGATDVEYNRVICLLTLQLIRESCPEADASFLTLQSQ
jgi:DNA/RNA-binding domain of Phe-tRNA-synthetase-like protein